MSTYFFWVAALLSAVTFCVHTFIGEPRVAGPLLAESKLPKASKWLNYYCWHITTIFTFSMGFGFAFVAMHPDRPDLVFFLSPLTAAMSILSVLVALRAKINPFRFPSTSLFALVSLVSFLGLLAR